MSAFTLSLPAGLFPQSFLHVKSIKTVLLTNRIEQLTERSLNALLYSIHQIEETLSW